MMPDREKVIKGLEHCRKTSCESCPYNAADVKSSNPICLINEMLSDALALLKEQEAVKPKSKVRHGANAQIQHFCGNCNSILHGKPKYCSECGKGVSW